MPGEDFDWVEARFRCNIRELFARLQDRVAADVESAKENGVGAEFECLTQDRFIVRVPAPTSQSRDWRTFTRAGVTIEIYGEGNEPILSARANLIGKDCMLMVKAGSRDLGEMRLWQFSREALEPLFFNGR